MAIELGANSCSAVSLGRVYSRTRHISKQTLTPYHVGRQKRLLVNCSTSQGSQFYNSSNQNRNFQHNSGVKKYEGEQQQQRNERDADFIKQVESYLKIYSIPKRSKVEELKLKLKQGLELLNKVWPMGSLFLLMAFVNTILDSMKDTLVVTAVGGGAQVIPYLTVYAVLPASVIFLVGYAYLSQRLNQEGLFNIIIGSFAVFFMVFGFVWYPNHEALHLNEFAASMAPYLPPGLEGMVGMVQNWTFTLFYVMSELWGDVGLSLMFWGLANEITSRELAPQIYPLFGVGANIAQVMAGYCLKGLGAAACHGHCSFAREFQVIMGMVCATCFAILVVHFFICRSKKKVNVNVPRDPTPRVQDKPPISDLRLKNGRNLKHQFRVQNGNGNGNGNGVIKQQSQQQKYFPLQNGIQQLERSYSLDSGQPAAEIPKPQGKKSDKKQKLTTWQAMKVVMSSKAIQCLAIMTVAQGITINLMGYVWKIHLKLLHPSPAAFSQFMGDVAAWTGWVTGSLMLIAPYLFVRFGWKGVAVTTPMLLSSFGLMFFGACFVHSLVPAFSGHEFLRYLTIGGALLYIVAKGAKFSLFKPAEEMVFISLNETQRTKGKAAIDVVGVQVGKAGVSVMQQALLLLFAGQLIGSLPAMCVIFFYFLRSWVKAVTTLADTHDFEGHGDANLEHPPQSRAGPPSPTTPHEPQSPQYDLYENTPLRGVPG